MKRTNFPHIQTKTVNTILELVRLDIEEENKRCRNKNKKLHLIRASNLIVKTQEEVALALKRNRKS